MKSVIAAFRDSGTAHQAITELGANGISESSILTLDERSDGGEIMRRLISHQVPRDRAEMYAEGVRRGAVLVVADTRDEDAPRIAQLLDNQGSIDFDTASERWRSSGWTGYQEGSGMLSEDERRLELADLEREQLRPQENLGGDAGNLEVIEEEVRVGKREVARGGVRVRAFVTERPVREALQLRDERIDVTREEVDEPLAASNTDFTEEEFEVTATGEEPVVEKRARVVERVHVGKEAETHTETIEETERRRDVEVERIEPENPEVRRH